MRARRPRTQDACGSRFLVPGSRFGTPAHPGTLRIARMRAGTPAHPGGMWFSVPGSWFSVRDAHTPGTRRGRAHAGGTPALLARAGVAHMRAGTPAHPGCMWFSVPGSWFSVRDARAPRRHVVLGSWFLVLGSWFLVPGSWFLVLGSRFGTPAHPGTLSAVAPQGLPRAQRGLMDFE